MKVSVRRRALVVRLRRQVSGEIRSLRHLSHEFVAEVHACPACLAFERTIKRIERRIFVDVGAQFAADDAPTTTVPSHANVLYS